MISKDYLLPVKILKLNAEACLQNTLGMNDLVLTGGLFQTLLLIFR